jgi:hypothetical protein
MPDFTVRFIGHIDELRRPEGFPHEVTAIGTYRADDNKGIADIVNNELMAFVHQINGMIVQLDPAQIVDLSKVNVKGRYYVPMSMISYIRTEIVNMTKMPELVDTGILNAHGKEVKTYELDGKKVLPS